MKNIKECISLENVIGGAVVLALIASLFSVVGIGIQSTNAATTSTSQTINLTVNQTITLSLSTSTLSLGSLTPGVAIVATSSATIVTNSAAGWQLQVNRNSATSTLASSTITFPDYSSWNSGSSNATTTPGATLSFKVANTGTDAGLYSSSFWGATDADGTAKYAGFPTSTQQVANIATYSSSNQVVVLRVRADSPASQQATNYTGTITVTALTNP